MAEENMRSSNFVVRDYILFETCIAVIINIGLALVFAILAFHGEARVQLFGRHGLIFDAIPQTFMGALMTVFVVLLITGLRLRRGKCGEARSGHRILHVFGIAIFMAIASTFICVGLAALILPRVDASGMDYNVMLEFKCVYSAVLAMIITPLALLTVF